MGRARQWLLIMTACCLVAPAATAGDEGARPVLRLRNGGYVSGQLAASDNSTEIVWQGDGFARPLRFPLAGVHAVQYPQPAARVPSMEPYCFELAGGDMLTGQLISLDEREAVLEIAAVGKVTVERSALRRFYRIGGAELIYSGPTGLQGWVAAGGENAWRDEGGQLSSDVVGATIGRNDRPPAVVRYEIELAWSETPNFDFSAGLSQDVPGRIGFRLETWDDQLVVTRESDAQADFALLQKIEPGEGTVALSVLFDEVRGRLIVYSSTGQQLADFTVPPDTKPPRPLPRVQFALPVAIPGAPPEPALPTALLLTNRRGKLTLQHLAIHRWSGVAPQSTAVGEAAVHLSEGENPSGEIRAFDAATRQLVIAKDGKEQRIDERLLQGVFLGKGTEPRQGSVRILLINGARLSGEIQRFEQDALVLQSPAIKQPLTLAVKELQAIVPLGSTAADEGTAATYPRLELRGVSLHGTLDEARQTGDSDSCLVFHPTGSTTASPLAADASGKLIFRRVIPAPVPKPEGMVQEGRPRQIFGGLITLPANTKPATVRPKSPGDCLLHLRSGDTLPCRVQSIDEQGVNFTSAVTEASFVPHARIKALELRLDVRPVKIEKTRFNRLLTLPRMQRDNPPEHLIRSLEGDYLRGRIISLNDKELEVEMRLEAKKVARDQIARILWLHPDEHAKATVVKPVAASDQKVPLGIRVQAVPRTGNRLTFMAQELAGTKLSGQSELLGACHVDTDQIDNLLIGAAIEEAAATLAFHQWKLRAAAEPLPDPDPNADPGSGEGMESVLVGKSAPEIELDLLAGGKFRLGDYKDKVVILDFWASWCGPCLQAMPQVDKVAGEFAEQGVKLIAINLEESPEKIKTALSRLGLETAVALDKDGRVAERYGASDIPQTVIVGRDGKVARLFIGAGSRFDERLREALKAVLKN